MLSEILELMEAVAVADGQKERVKSIYQARRNLLMILEDGECYSLKELAVNGKDLIALGIEPGRAMGDCLNKMMEAVLNDPSKNTKDYLISLIQ